MVVIVVEAQVIRSASLAVDPARTGIQALRARSTVKRRKSADDVVRRLCPAHAHIEVVLRSPLASTLSAATFPADGANFLPWPRSRAKVVDKPQIHGVRIAIRRGDEMKVLRRSRQIGRWNKIQ